MPAEGKDSVDPPRDGHGTVLYRAEAAWRELFAIRYGCPRCVKDSPRFVVNNFYDIRIEKERFTNDLHGQHRALGRCPFPKWSD